MERITAVLLFLFMIFTFCSGCDSDIKTNSETPIPSPTIPPGVSASPSPEKTQQGQSWLVEVRVVDEDIPETYLDATIYSDLAEKLSGIPLPANEISIGYVGKAADNEFWQKITNGMLEQSGIFKSNSVSCNVDCIGLDSRLNEEWQANDQFLFGSTLIDQNCDLLIISPVACNNLAPMIEKAHGKGITVINCFDRFCKETDVYIGPSYVTCGALAAEWISKNIAKEQQTEVAIIDEDIYERKEEARKSGFIDWMSENAPNCSIVATYGVDEYLDAKEIMRMLIDQYPNLKAVYCVNDEIALDAMASVKEYRKFGQIAVVGSNGTSAAIESIKAGELSATVSLQPKLLGKITLEIALRYLGGQEIPSVIFTPQAVIDLTNIELSDEMIIGWQTPSFQS